jgi:hypothetical protein
MRKFLKFSSGCLAVVLALAPAAAVAWAGAPREAASTHNKLVGTWKVVSAKYGGKEVKRPKGFTHLKHVTPTQFMWAIYGEDGKVVAALGGIYTLKGDEYVETPEYGVGEGLLDQLKGKAQVFKWKVEGNKWYHTGKLSSGLTIEEVWERVEKK